MTDYTHEYSNFPDAPLTLSHYEDVTDETANIINTYKKYLQNEQYDAAAAYAKKNKEFLEKHLLGSGNFMALQEEIRNTQILALKKSQSIHAKDSAPSVMELNDVWIGG